MIEFIKNWVTNITVIIIFIAIMEILIPQSDFKRFIRVVIGLLIILVIIKPFVLAKDIQSQFNTSVVFNQSLLDESSIEDKSNEIYQQQKEKAVEVFNDNLTKQIKSIITNQNDIDSNNIIVNLDIEKDISKSDFGKLKKINVIINEQGTSAIAVAKIEDIAISQNVSSTPDKNVINDSTNEYNFTDNKICSEIKRSLTSALGINQNDITVKVQESN